jgi:hypothetical protein
MLTPHGLLPEGFFHLWRESIRIELLLAPKVSMTYKLIQYEHGTYVIIPNVATFKIRL